ncbi:TPM domain-containing protein [Sphingomonas sp. MMS24-JH45]
MDAARILPRATIDRVTAVLASLERRTDTRRLVVTGPSLRGLTVERSSLALFNGLGIGRACCDDGVGAAHRNPRKNGPDRSGKGLERALTNAEARRMMPRLRGGGCAGGVEADAAIVAEIDA